MAEIYTTIVNDLQLSNWYDCGNPGYASIISACSWKYLFQTSGNVVTETLDKECECKCKVNATHVSVWFPKNSCSTILKCRHEWSFVHFTPIWTVLLVSSYILTLQCTKICWHFLQQSNKFTKRILLPSKKTKTIVTCDVVFRFFWLFIIEVLIKLP